jgi:hypothetical protein
MTSGHLSKCLGELEKLAEIAEDYEEDLLFKIGK